ncbi:hypothetical protein BC827DRAFT_1273361 [Russula dissimulans]|nr:hypothetical protein BC827DRAFT_1273361 [Russula dissimulans]
MAEVKITPHITSPPLIPSRRNSSTVPTLCTFRATPAQALRMHNALRSCHSLAMHFAMFEGSDVEAFEPKIELDPATETDKIAVFLGSNRSAESTPNALRGERGLSAMIRYLREFIGRDHSMKIAILTLDEYFPYGAEPI